MAVTATSTAALAVKSATDLLIASAIFSARIAAYGGGATAAERVYYDEADEWIEAMALSTFRPFAVVGLGENMTYSPINQSCVSTQLTAAGGVYVAIVDNARFTDYPTTDAQNDSSLDFLNFFGGILDDMSGAFNSDTDLIGFSSIELMEPPARTTAAERENDDYWAAIVRFNFDRGQ